MDALKKIFSFFGLCFWVLGTLGGFGYACYSKAYVIAVAVLGAMAFPTAKKFFKDLTE